MKRILFIALTLLLMSACTEAEEIATVAPTQTAVTTASPTDTPILEPTRAITVEPSETPVPGATLEMRRHQGVSTRTSPSTRVSTEAPTPEPFTTTIAIGQSVNGNEITVTKLGSGETAVLLIGGFHAGFAPATVSLAEQVIDYYTENNQTLLTNITLYVIANANPDSLTGEVGEMNGRSRLGGARPQPGWAKPLHGLPACE